MITKLFFCNLVVFMCALAIIRATEKPTLDMYSHKHLIIIAIYALWLLLSFASIPAILIYWMIIA